MNTDPLSARRIQGDLRTTCWGRNLVCLPEVPSTNDYARQLAQTGAPEGTVVVAEHQTAGRGRYDRRWIAAAGTSLLCSLIFRPRMIPSQAQRLTMICALALADGIESQSDLAVRLKWPNDIMINGKKAGGILTELEVRTGVLDYAIVGVGLNVNLDLAHLPADVSSSATSLAHETGRFISRAPLLRQFLEALEERYQQLQAGQSPHSEWTNRLAMMGSRVAVRSGDERLEGIAEGVNELGALLIRLDDGNLRTVLAGDVTVQR